MSNTTKHTEAIERGASHSAAENIAQRFDTTQFATSYTRSVAAKISRFDSFVLISSCCFLLLLLFVLHVLVVLVVVRFVLFVLLLHVLLRLRSLLLLPRTLLLLALVFVALQV